MSLPAEEEPLSEEEHRLLAWLEQQEVHGGRFEPSAVPVELRQTFERLPQLLECLNQLHSFAGEPAPATGSDNSLSMNVLPRDFGPYLLEEEIGRGGMGVVYKARHRKLQSYVALKMVRSCEFATQQEVRRFYQEGQAAARLRHPHIVSVYDAGELHGIPYLVMSYVDGVTLADRLRQNRVELDQLVKWLVAVARAVGYLHREGIVHRDLKPANILIDAHSQPYVTDFGLAKLFFDDGERTATGTVIGTPAYMAPEQAWGQPVDVTPGCDLYSLGAILYEMLTGKAPFAELNPFDQILRLREADPPRPRHLRADVPAELEQVCLRCLERNPQNRYATADLLADDLERFLRQEPITLQPFGLWQRYRRWMLREPALSAHLSAFATLAIVVQAAELLSTRHRESYWPVMTVLAVWAGLSTVLQSLLSRDVQRIKLVWVAVDGVLFTVAVAYAQAPIESLAVGYAVLIAASGLWYQRSLVWLTTAVSVVSYGLLIWFRGAAETPGHYPFLVMGMLAVVGGIVGGLVKRIRQLLHVQAGG
ncbi:serine/threonine-protein kinase [Planctomicrobium sp. SH664]|uniref:serine/threonine-protein kinase n=1 Tax=Planctomicrobium sp. SH664 TaxID=3448125 RepID=UPI003F5C9640